jgi:membrane-bound serine protease (ClpP class)
VRFSWICGLALLARAAFAAPQAVAVNIDGVVHPITVEIVSRALEQAQRENAAFLLIRLNTPGGLMEATRQLTEKIIAAPMPVVAYVTPSGGRAASAGFFLLQAADVAVMAPGTRTGAAHPVALGGEMDPVMKQKVVNDAAAQMRSVAERRGRNAALAETAVTQSKSFTAREALDQKLIDFVARNQEELTAQLHGREVTRFSEEKTRLNVAGVVVQEYEKSLREKIISSIADPNIALILVVLGALGIYVEFSAPGLILPGAAGAISALVGLSALAVLPINWLGAALMILALALFVLEAKITSHGVLGVSGAVAMVLGAMLLVDSPMPEMRIQLSTALALAIPFAAITMFLVSLVVRARENKVISGAEGMIGEVGVALIPLEPVGKVFVHGEYWDAVSSEPVAAGQRVEVTAIDHLKLKVRPTTGG